jgi:hypothetical protein
MDSQARLFVIHRPEQAVCPALRDRAGAIALGTSEVWDLDGSLFDVFPGGVKRSVRALIRQVVWWYRSMIFESIRL